MQIEVPSDKYDDAIRAMEEKIRRGQVEGVSNPEEAKNIIRKGHFTYEQARNIAKAGTIESLTYDAVNGTIVASTAFGVTAMITLATSVWNGDDFDDALKLATYSGLKVGGTAFVTSILASQLSKAGLNSALVGSSEAIVAIMGPKASAILINAFRYGSKPIYGAAAMKSAAKLLRGNAITAGVTFVVLSTIDVADIFRGRISGKQLFKNLTNTAATVSGGTGGWIAGAATGSAILPGLNSALVGSSEAIVAIMGPKASAILINAFRYGSKPIYGAAAMKSAAKLLRGNAITAGVTFVVLSTIDVADIFRGRISGKQLFKNLTNTAATVSGGTGGWIAGAATGSAILPGIGTVVGGLAGSILGGAAAGKVTNTVVGVFVEDDADEMVKIIENVFTEMASEYLLSQKEAEKSVDCLRDKLDGKTLKNMYASSDKKKFARNLLTPIIEREISCRTMIPALTQTQMISSIREVLEEIADTVEANPSLVNA